MKTEILWFVGDMCVWQWGEGRRMAGSPKPHFLGLLLHPLPPRITEIWLESRGFCQSQLGKHCTAKQKPHLLSIYYVLGNCVYICTFNLTISFMQCPIYSLPSPPGELASGQCPRLAVRCLGRALILEASGSFRGGLGLSSSCDFDLLCGLRQVS